MKKIILSVLVIIMLGACSKKGNSPVNNSNTPNHYPNIVTVVTDGKSYSAQGYESATHPSNNFVKGYIIKESSGSSSLHIVTKGVDHEFEIAFDGIGPANGVGDFDLKNSFGYFEELFQGGEKYDITAGKITVSTATNSSIVGTYTFDVENTARVKSINGSFNISKPGL